MVTATGTKTYFGKTTELVSVAHVESGEQKAVLGVVRALVAVVACAQAIGMTVPQVIPLVLTALLSAVQVALPATVNTALHSGIHRFPQALGFTLVRLKMVC